WSARPCRASAPRGPATTARCAAGRPGCTSPPTRTPCGRTATRTSARGCPALLVARAAPSPGDFLEPFVRPLCCREQRTNAHHYVSSLRSEWLAFGPEAIFVAAFAVGVAGAGLFYLLVRRYLPG